MDSIELKSRLRGKTILLTGASGYIGSNLALRLATLGCGLVRWSRKPLPHLQTASFVRDFQGSLTCPETWTRALDGVDSVVHLAAQTSTYEAARDPLGDFNLNARPMLAMLTACNKLHASPYVVFASTSTACGMPLETPVGPEHPDNPVTIYDTHKLLAEHYLKHFSREGVVRGTSLRLSNIYGPGPKSSRPDRGILNMMIRRGLAGEALTVYGEGHQVRDYLFIDDTVDAFLHALAKPDETDGRHFVLGSGTGWSIYRALQLISELTSRATGKVVEVVHVDPPQHQSVIEDRNFIADVSAFSESTGWIPTIELSQGIDQTIAFFMAQEPS